MDSVYFVAAAWMGLALVSIRLGISVALIEIVVGVVAGNVGGLESTPWIDVLAMFGSVLLTFLAGTEIDPASLRRHIRLSLAVGVVSFAVPFAAAFGYAYLVAGWDLPAAEIARILGKSAGCVRDMIDKCAALDGLLHPGPQSLAGGSTDKG